MKKIALITTLITGLSFFVSAQPKNFIDLPYIEITGTADTLVVPDMIFIKIVISEKDTKDKISVEETENKLVEGLKTLNINTEKNFAAFDMGSNYRSYFLKKKDVIKSKEYILQVPDAVSAGKVFMLLEDLDISNSSIERVDHSGTDNLKNNTRIKAAENAKIKAAALAKAMGQSIGAAIYISDSENAAAGNYQKDNVRFLQKRKNEYDKSIGETPKIEFEKMTVSAAVSVKFILKGSN